METSTDCPLWAQLTHMYKYIYIYIYIYVCLQVAATMHLLGNLGDAAMCVNTFSFHNMLAHDTICRCTRFMQAHAHGNELKRIWLFIERFCECVSTSRLQFLSRYHDISNAAQLIRIPQVLRSFALIRSISQFTNWIIWRDSHYLWLMDSLREGTSGKSARRGAASRRGVPNIYIYIYICVYTYTYMCMYI